MSDESKSADRLLDGLEKYLARDRALLIHMDGYDVVRYPAGLGLKCTGRTLREALQGLADVELPAPPAGDKGALG